MAELDNMFIMVLNVTKKHLVSGRKQGVMKKILKSPQKIYL